MDAIELKIEDAINNGTGELEALENQDPPEPTEAEVKAREQGWRPVEEWSGDTSKHQSAEEFLERNQRSKERGDSLLKAENARQASQIDGMQKTLDDLVKFTKKADSRARQKALDEIRAEQRAAVEEGDTAAFDAAADKMTALEKDVAEEPAAKTEQNPDDDPAFIEWAKDNDWYGADGDPELTLFAEESATVIARKYKGAELYKRVEDRVRAKFPDHFKAAGNPNRGKASAVEGTANTKPAGKTLWSEVPKDAHSVFKSFVEQGLYEDTKEGREQYADVYLNG